MQGGIGTRAACRSLKDRFAITAKVFLRLNSEVTIQNYIVRLLE
jgi:hypothetical protein